MNTSPAKTKNRIDEYTLLIGPDPALKKVCTPCGDEDVNHISNALLSFARNYGTQRGVICIGLAANQLGFDKRVCVVRVKGKYKVFIDPEIVEGQGQVPRKERCLSWPGRVFETIRHHTVWVKARNVKKPMKLVNTSAICIQHEIDHLNGKEV